MFGNERRGEQKFDGQMRKKIEIFVRMLKRESLILFLIIKSYTKWKTIIHKLL